MSLRRLALLLVPLLAPAALAAQDLDSRADIVVTGKGQSLDPNVVTRQAREVTRETDIRYEPLPRFDGYACPGVIGLSQEYAEMLVGRIRMIAEDLHIPLAPNGNCHPNIFVSFTEDGRADLAAIQKKTHLLTDVLTVQEQDELLEEPGPVRVLSVVETRMQNGAAMPRRKNLTDIPTATMEGGQSLISTATERHITQVVVLFDREHAAGKTLHQLADYAVMRVFARTRDAKGGDAPVSILGLFDENGSPPDGMTAFDRAYLAALYEGPSHTKGIAKIMRVSKKLEKMKRTDDE
uniref:hypothetical protein n=1 Tax=Altererythrobacter segetis TaxID=1104773 RepID=UPI00140C539C|nr:hypothetical protein [Altererythrobacter segetis]